MTNVEIFKNCLEEIMSYTILKKNDIKYYNYSASCMIFPGRIFKATLVVDKKASFKPIYSINFKIISKESGLIEEETIDFKDIYEMKNGIVPHMYLNSGNSMTDNLYYWNNKPDLSIIGNIINIMIDNYI